MQSLLTHQLNSLKNKTKNDNQIYKWNGIFIKIFVFMVLSYFLICEKTTNNTNFIKKILKTAEGITWFQSATERKIPLSTQLLLCIFAPKSANFITKRIWAALQKTTSLIWDRRRLSCSLNFKCRDKYYSFINYYSFRHNLHSFLIHKIHLCCHASYTHLLIWATTLIYVIKK